MKKYSLYRIILVVFILFLLFESSVLAIHRIDRLHMAPDELSPVVWPFPDCINVVVLEYRDGWALLRIDWNIQILLFSSQGCQEGWVLINERETQN